MRIALITPALGDANNGNWQTAKRWADMLSSEHTVELAQSYADLPVSLARYDCLIALHARRSAASVAAFAHECPQKPLWVVLTGTDLYRDINTDIQAQQSLQLATQLIVLQEQGVFDLPTQHRHKTTVVFQSAPRTMHVEHKEPVLNICVVGHLRAEKSPETTFAIAAELAKQHNICITHIGKALSDEYVVQAQQTQTRYPQHYRWMGGLNHAQTLETIASSDLLLHPSAMEGGALAIIEAIQSGTPVVASRVAGHIGLLGNDYAGLFEWGNAHAASDLIVRYQTDAAYQNTLQLQCSQRSVLFDPETERLSLLNLLTI